MISFVKKKINRLTQEIYNDYIFSLDFSTCSCDCPARGRFCIHGYYTRSIKSPVEKITLKILRIKCKSCERTHAVLHPSIVPYSQIVLVDTMQIISNTLNNESSYNVINQNPEITESDVRYTVKKFMKHWKERILSLSPTFILEFLKTNDFAKLVSKAFNLAFMQVKCCFYSLV